MSDLVRAGIRDEIIKFEPLVERKLTWKRSLSDIKAEINKYKITEDKEEVIKKLRKARKEIYAKKHKKK